MWFSFCLCPTISYRYFTLKLKFSFENLMPGNETNHIGLWWVFLELGKISMCTVGHTVTIGYSQILLE